MSISSKPIFKPEPFNCPVLGGTADVVLRYSSTELNESPSPLEHFVDWKCHDVRRCGIMDDTGAINWNACPKHHELIARGLAQPLPPEP
jgi:hypothetical protein